MINRAEREKQDQQRWWERFSRGRMKLSASVEETLANAGVEEEDGDELDEPGEELSGQQESEANIIRPRLSLQSRPLPAVTAPSQLRQLPAVIEPPTLVPETGARQAAPEKRRLAGRSTRVKLQALSKHEKKTARKTRPLVERAEAGQAKAKAVVPVLADQETVTEASSAVQVSQVPVHEKLSGRGMIPKGKAEALVENSHVTSASVVLVSLLSNPGQVVVLYFTLLPGYGFTVHLSAEVVTDTAFNYAILLGELL
jgi:hypothetical protein